MRARIVSYPEWKILFGGPPIHKYQEFSQKDRIMIGAILIAGTGKMGRNIGLFLMEKGYQIAWFSSSEERSAALEASFMKRYEGMKSKGLPLNKVPIFLFPQKMPKFETAILIESVKEAVTEKKRIIDLLNKNYHPKLILSNSSSILPSKIHSQCAGLHFFYPIQLTSFAEIIFPDNYSLSDRSVLTGFVCSAGLEFVIENTKSAFAVNRLLLPLQTESILLFHEGISPSLIEQASRSQLLAAGQLSLLSSIGKELVRTSARNYKSRMGKEDAVEMELLIGGIGGFPGKFSFKNDYSQEDLNAYYNRFLYLFVNTCLNFIEREILNEQEMNLILQRVFGAEMALENVIIKENRQKIRDTLRDFHTQTGRSYFKPSGLLE